MPVSGRPDDHDTADATVSNKTKTAAVDVALANVSTIVIQNWNRSGVHAPMLAPLELGDLHYKSNISSVLGMLLRKAGYHWSSDGTQLWHPGFC